MATDRHEANDHRAETREIVVGVDGSLPSKSALVWAAALAHDRGLALKVLYAVNMPMIAASFGQPARTPPPAEMEERASELLSETAGLVSKTYPDLAVRTRTSPMEPAQALLAEAEHAELLVVGSRGLGGVGSLFLGSVSVRVSSHAPCPVVVIPPEYGDEPHGRLEGDRRVVVGVDGSPLSDAALRFALKEAARIGAGVTVVHTWQTPASIDPLTLRAAGFTLERETMKTHAQGQVNGLVAEARTPETEDVPVRVVVGEEQPASMLLTEGEGADLIVVGSRGRGGFRGLLLGSVGQAVLHHASAPVAVVRTQKKNGEKSE